MSTAQPLTRIPLTTLKGVGEKVAQKLKKLGLESVQDALFHLPLRYEDRTRIAMIAQLRPGQSANLVVDVQHAEIKYGRKRMLLVRAKDDSGSITLRFFQFSAAQLKQFSAGTRVLVFGEVRHGMAGAELIHPDYQLLEANQQVKLEPTYTPVYPTTEGVYPAALRKIIEQALSYLTAAAVEELLPASLQPHQLSLVDAIKTLHHPPVGTSLQQLELGQHPAQQRLAVEELLAHQISLLQLRQQRQSEGGIAIRANGELAQQFLATLPFKPTQAQQRVVAEIANDLQKSVPMMRLVQGDVGSGKTLVAALAALAAIEAGYQVALMAPTELLSEQHALSFSQWLEPLGIGVGWLSGRTKGKARQQLLQQVADGEVAMLVGTHALFQDDVQ